MAGSLTRAILLRRYSSYKMRKLDYLFHCSRSKRVILFSNPKSAGSTLKRLVQLIETNGDESRIPENVHDKERSPLCGLSCYLDKICGEKRTRYLSKLGVEEKNELSLAEFLRLLRNQRNLYRNPHWAPQSYLIRPDTIRYSFIGRFEYLHDHLRALTERLGCEHFMERMSGISVTHHRTGAGERVRKFIGPREASLIREIYDRDFTYFAYPRDPQLCHV